VLNSLLVDSLFVDEVGGQPLTKAVTSGRQ